MSLADQIRYKHNNTNLIGQSLTSCVTLAHSVGQMADKGARHSVPDHLKPTFCGAVQVGEYIITGKVPESQLVLSVVG